MNKAIYQKSRVIFACKNPLFGDGSFGTKVIRFLEFVYTLSTDTACLDVGEELREFLLDILLLKQKPSQIIIIDAMEISGSVIGEIKEIRISNNQPLKRSDFSLHQLSTVNMLKTIRSYSAIDVRMLLVNPGEIPSQVKPGLNPGIESTVPLMCERILDILEKPTTGPNQPKSGRIFIRVDRLAEKLGVHRNTINRWIKDGKIKAQPTVGRRYAIEQSEFIRFWRQSGKDEQVVRDFL